LLVVWQVLAVVVQHRLFPTPVHVIAELVDLAATGPLLSDLAKTLTRAIWAFFIAMTVGTILGLVLGRLKLVDRLFSPWVVVGLNVPAIVVAITCYIWLGLNEFALVLAVVINKTPLVITAVREGVRNLSVDFDELARVYRFGPPRYLSKVLVPQLMPYVLTAARTGLSLIWKIVLVFEVLGSDGGVGFRVGVLFQYFDISGILAYTIAFIIVVLIIEYGVMRPLERSILGWRMARA
jgi:NitT/TauT family transport system permease protein